MLSGSAVVYGSAGNDTISVSGCENTVDDGDGNDVINTSCWSTGTTGEGADVVNLTDSFNFNEDASALTNLTDMNPAADVIVIDLNGNFALAPGGDTTVAVAQAANGTDVEITYGVNVIGVLQNTDINDIAIGTNVFVIPKAA